MSMPGKAKGHTPRNLAGPDEIGDIAGTSLLTLGLAALGWSGVSSVLSFEATTVFVVGLFGVLTVPWFVHEVSE